MMKYLILIFCSLFSFSAFSDFKAPAKTVVGTGSYTVPAGRWARVLVDVAAVAYTSSASGNNGNVGVAASSESKNVELILKSGDALTFSSSNASGTASCTSSTSAAGGMSVASGLVNAVVVVSVRAGASAACYSTGSAASTSITGSTSTGFIASEYFN